MLTYKNDRLKFIIVIFALFLGISAVTRTVLLFTSLEMVDLGLIQLIRIYLVGAFYDFVAVSYLAIPIIIYLMLLSDKIYYSKIHNYLKYIFLYIIICGFVFYSFSEWFFWDEFNVRFNFIAVDYLVYTKEVIGNIIESYPLNILLSVIALISVFILIGLYKLNVISTPQSLNSSLKERIKIFAFNILLPIIFFFGVNSDISKISANEYNNELSKSGLYSLFSAFRNNSLDYKKFYKTQEDKKVFSNLKRTLDMNKTIYSDDNYISIEREIVKSGREKDYNIIFLVVESLSGKFLKSLGADKSLTPNLDSLAKDGMFFNNFYATGTRTVRGMESIILSVPPTPGRSIVKRPDNHNMFSSGFIFRNKGYDTKFIYGGYGYFDNMNDFFLNNGFKVVDRTSFSQKEDTFHTIWGVCDEDLFNKTIKEADNSYKQHKPFMSFVMTTSNHRPYDYPNGRIDIPSHSGRDGAVKYTDYAIGSFIKKAKTKPWFCNTIFVIVADHCASSAGKTALPLHNYHIPLIVYAPDKIKPKVITKVSSQIDLMPTILSLLNWSYKSKFYGNDILSDSFKERALIGTYQKLGLYKDNKLTVLLPGKKIQTYKILEQDIRSTKYKKITKNTVQENEIITYYQGASQLHKKRLDRYNTQIDSSF